MTDQIKRTAKTVQEITDGQMAVRISDEYDSLPEVTNHDEYLHFKDQLERMRARTIKHSVQVKAMETALFLRLCDYEKRTGLPESEIPESG